MSDKLQEFLDTQHHILQARKRTYKIAINAFEKIANTPFDQAYLDAKTVHYTLNNLGIEPSTWNMWLTIYKRYSRWLSDPDDEVTPKLWRKLQPKKIDWNQKLKDKWLTEKEFKDLLDATDHPCPKAAFATAISGALRRGELLNLKIKDAEVNGSEIRVTVSGKTGTRSFLMNQFAPILKHWLNFHPLKSDPEAPLFTRRKTGNGEITDGIQAQAMDSSFKMYAKRAGIRKPVSLHWLRHTKVTWTARNKDRRITDKQANICFGWSPNSDSYKHYTHLHGTDTDETFRALDGVITKSQEAEQIKFLERQKCFNCNEYNTAEALYCYKCGCVLSEEQAKRIVAEKEMMDYFMKRFMEEQGKQ
jgi:integrase